MPFIVNGLFGNGVKLLRRREQIDKCHFVLGTDFLHCVGIEFQLLVVLQPVRKMWTAQVFMRDGRKHNNSRRAHSIVSLFAHVSDHLSQIPFKPSQRPLATQGLVVPEEAEHHIGFTFCEPLIGTAKILRTRSGLHFVAREAKISDCSAHP